VLIVLLCFFVKWSRLSAEEGNGGVMRLWNGREASDGESRIAAAGVNLSHQQFLNTPCIAARVILSFVTQFIVMT